MGGTSGQLSPMRMIGLTQGCRAFLRTGKKYREFCTLAGKSSRFCPKFAKFRFELRKGTGKKQESAKNLPNPMLLLELIDTRMKESGK